jgi:uncharacterized protein
MISETINEELAGPAPAPVSVTERLPSLDVLRGFALLGILMANIQDFASPTGILHDIPIDVVSRTGAHPTLDAVVMTFQWLFIEGKMRALFGLLFGAGAVLLLERIEKRSGTGRAADIFHRRNMWLVLFGVLHGSLIWNGDILLHYGSLALLALYPLRHVAGKHLVRVGIAISLIGGTLGLSNALDLGAAFPSAILQMDAAAANASHIALSARQKQAVDAATALRTKELQAIPDEVKAGRSGYLASEPENAKGEADFVALVFRRGWIFEILGIMIAGMGLYKTGFLSARLPSRVYLRTAIIGYVISATLVLGGLYQSRRFGFSDAVTTIYMFLPYGIEQIGAMLANASVLLLLVRHRRLLFLQRGLAAVGRTALTNYLFTSVACQFLFRWGPWKLYGALEYYQQLYVVVCVWGINIAASLLWLRFFSFGPLEWLWRSLTYWKVQPLVTHRTDPYLR